MLKISQTVYVDIAHFFEGHPIESNRRVHGHTIAITVAAEGERGGNGMVQHFDVFKAQISDIASLIDHRLLNEIKGLEDPSLENLAEWFGVRMSLVGSGAVRIVSVRAERAHLGQAAEWTP